MVDRMFRYVDIDDSVFFFPNFDEGDDIIVKRMS